MKYIRREPVNTCSMDNTYTFTRRQEFGKLREVEVAEVYQIICANGLIRIEVDKINIG